MSNYQITKELWQVYIQYLFWGFKKLWVSELDYPCQDSMIVIRKSELEFIISIINITTILFR